jgi:hypothetical protein
MRRRRDSANTLRFENTRTRFLLFTVNAAHARDASNQARSPRRHDLGWRLQPSCSSENDASVLIHRDRARDRRLMTSNAEAAYTRHAKMVRN